MSLFIKLAPQIIVHELLLKINPPPQRLCQRWRKVNLFTRSTICLRHLKLIFR